MKFNNLTTMQKLLILAGLTGYKNISNKVSEEPYIRPEELSEYDVSVHGLSMSIATYRLSRNETFYPYQSDDNNRHIHLRFLANENQNDVSFNFHLKSADNYDDVIKLGRYNIGQDIVIKGHDIEKSLNSTLSFLRGFEELFKLDDSLSSIVFKMIAKINDAQNLPYALLDRMFINTVVSKKIRALFSVIFSRYAIDPFYEFMSDNEKPDIPKPDYVIETIYRGYKIYHSPTTENPKSLVLMILSSSLDDMITVGYSEGYRGKFVRLGSFVPEDNDDEKIFIKNVLNGLRTVVLDSDQGDNLKNKLGCFTDALNSIIADPEYFNICLANGEDHGQF